LRQATALTSLKIRINALRKLTATLKGLCLPDIETNMHLLSALLMKLEAAACLAASEKARRFILLLSLSARA